MNDLLLDTGLFVALVSKRDPHRKEALAVADSISAGRYTSVSTTDLILAETWNYIRMKIKQEAAAQAIRRLAFGTSSDPPLVSKVYRVHGHRFAAALERYESRFDAGLSFTDWTSIIVMQDEGIGTIATFDPGFAGNVPNVVPDMRQ